MLCSCEGVQACLCLGQSGFVLSGFGLSLQEHSGGLKVPSRPAVVHPDILTKLLLVAEVETVSIAELQEGALVSEKPLIIKACEESWRERERMRMCEQCKRVSSKFFCLFHCNRKAWLSTGIWN